MSKQIFHSVCLKLQEMQISTPGHTGRMSAVAVGGAAWSHFDAAAETIDFLSAAALAVLAKRPVIVASFL